jgi:hypothetical protein
MIPDQQTIFTTAVSCVAVDGPWFYTGKYAIWNLQIVAVESGATILVELSNQPKMDQNNVNSPAYQPTTNVWVPNTAFKLNTLIVDYRGSVQKVTTAGISAPTPPNWKTSSTTTDGTITWTYQAVQGIQNYPSAPSSAATPVGVSLGGAAVNGTNAYSFNDTANKQVYVFPTGDSIYAAFVRVRKTVAGGSPTQTIAYLAGQIDS